MSQPTYRGSVKDVYTNIVDRQGNAAAVFAFSDAYSVFDWGKMPDLLAHKGAALTLMAADIFERAERPETWQEFSKSPGAQRLRRANRFGAAFNELGEQLQQQGLRTHYLGLLERSALVSATPSAGIRPQRLSDLREPVENLVVRQVCVKRPVLTQVMGRQIPDYFPTREAEPPRLVPLEVVFRFSCPKGSSLRARVAQDPSLLAQMGYSGLELGNEASPTKFDFPIIELFTKLESVDRALGLSEGLAISGLSASQLQELMFRSAWMAGWLRTRFERIGVELADGKFEWGLWPDGSLRLVDSVGPDELRILSMASPAGSTSGSPSGQSHTPDGIHLSKEVLRTYYRTTPWYQALTRAKNEAMLKGQSDWKRGVPEAPALPENLKEVMGHLYPSLVNEFCERKFFQNEWPLAEVVARLASLLNTGFGDAG